MAALALGALGIGGSLLGGLFSSSAAKKAAALQSAAAAQAGKNDVQTGVDAGNGVLAASGDAANRVNTATDQANGLLQGVYDKTMGGLQPYQDVGAAGANGLMGMLGKLTTPYSGDMMKDDPGYQFRLSEGQKALGGSQGAAGSALGGGALKQAMRYNQDYSSGEYQNAFNRDLATKNQQYGVLSGMTNTGMQANQMGILAGNSFMAPQAQNTINAGTYAGNAGIHANEYAGNANLQMRQAASDAEMGGANARAAGTVGSANAWSGALSGATNSAMGAYGLYQGGQRNNALMALLGRK